MREWTFCHRSSPCPLSFCPLVRRMCSYSWQCGGRFTWDAGHHWNVTGQSAVFVNWCGHGQMLKICGRPAHSIVTLPVADQTSRGRFLSLIEEVKNPPPCHLCSWGGCSCVSPHPQIVLPSAWKSSSSSKIWGTEIRQTVRLMYDCAPQATRSVSDYTNNITYFKYHFISNSEESLMINSN